MEGWRWSRSPKRSPGRRTPEPRDVGTGTFGRLVISADGSRPVPRGASHTILTKRDLGGFMRNVVFLCQISARRISASGAHTGVRGEFRRAGIPTDPRHHRGGL